MWACVFYPPRKLFFRHVAVKDNHVWAYFMNTLIETAAVKGNRLACNIKFCKISLVNTVGSSGKKGYFIASVAMLSYQRKHVLPRSRRIRLRPYITNHHYVKHIKISSHNESARTIPKQSRDVENYRVQQGV